MPEAVHRQRRSHPGGPRAQGRSRHHPPRRSCRNCAERGFGQGSALDKAEIDDVILGCAQPEGEAGFNMARFAALRAGLPVEVPGVTVNRLCASGLEAIAQADMRIRTGTDRVVVAGGAESMSMIPMGGSKPSPNPWLAENYPASLLTMGLTAERVARHYNISREDQDAFALAATRRRLAAQAAGRFDDELIPVNDNNRHPGAKAGKPNVAETVFGADEGPARRHLGGGPGQAQAGLSRAGNRHRRQRLADLRRSRRSGPDGGRPGARTRTPASGAPGGLHGHRVPAGGDGHRPHPRHSQGAEAWPGSRSTTSGLSS